MTRTGNIPKVTMRRPAAKEGSKVILAHEYVRPMIGPLTAVKKSAATKEKY